MLAMHFLSLILGDFIFSGCLVESNPDECHAVSAAPCIFNHKKRFYNIFR